MMPDPVAEAQLQALTDEYLERLQAGETPDVYAILEAHRHLAAELEPRLEAVEQLHRLAHTPIAAETAAAGSGSSGTPLPEQIGRYRILERLGQGATAVVYRAHDPKFAREVALKVVRRDNLAEGDGHERFLRDARAAAHLRHPNIVPLHETGADDGVQYIDMELVRGESLERRLRRQPLGFREAAELVQKVAAALDYAHRASIVHRDVKPSNILIDDRGEPQLADFGLARRIGGEASITAHGQLLGTPAYMSPEQARGDAHAADGRADVYSLGVVLYRLLTGRLPFAEGSSYSLLVQIAERPPARPRQLNPAVPVGLEAICLKAMEKQTADRFASAAEFADELWRWLHDEPLRIRPPGVWERARRVVRRHRAYAAVLLGAAFVVLVVCLVFGMLAWQAHVRRVLETEARAEVQAGSLLNQVRAELQTTTQGRRRTAQRLLRDAAEARKRITDRAVGDRLDLELRSAFAATLAVPELRLVHQVELPRDNFHVYRVAFHPSGNLLAIATHTRPLSCTTGLPFAVPGDDERNRPRPRLTYSPSGKFLVFAPVPGGLTLWDGDLTRVLAELERPGGSCTLAAGFEPQEKSLWTVRADGRITRWSLETLASLSQRQVKVAPGVREKRENAVLRALTAASFNPDATELTVADEGGTVYVCRPTDGVLRPLSATSAVRIERMAWSPNNRLLAFGSKDGVVQLWDTVKDLPVHRFPAFPAEVGDVCFDPEGKWLAAGSRVASEIWDVFSGHPVLSNIRGAVIAGFSRDGSRLAGASVGEARIYQLSARGSLFQLHGHRSVVQRLAWSADGSRVVSLDSSFEIRVWERARAACVCRLQGRPGENYAGNAAVALSDDGRSVAYASGGLSHVLIGDVASGRTKEWYLPVFGYDRLAPLAGGSFRLLRVEAVSPTSAATRTAVYTVGPNAAPSFTGVVREPVPTEKGFLNQELTPDGRYYLWVGPREPRAPWRVEVHDVSNRKCLFTKTLPCVHDSEPQVCLSADGSWLHLAREGRERTRYDLYDLKGDRPLVPPANRVAAILPHSQGFVVQIGGEDRARPHALGLQRTAEGTHWLELFNGDPGWSEVVVPSADGRYLAFGSLAGFITVVDLPALEAEVRAFEAGNLLDEDP